MQEYHAWIGNLEWAAYILGWMSQVDLGMNSHLSTYSWTRGGLPLLFTIKNRREVFVGHGQR